MSSLGTQIHTLRRDSRLFSRIWDRLINPLAIIASTAIGSLLVVLVRLFPLRVSSYVKSKLTLVYRAPGCDAVYLDINSPREIRRGNFAFREVQTADWARACGSKGGVFFDVGANVGMVSMIFASSVSTRGAVYAFEPHVPTFERLDSDFALNAPLHSSVSYNAFNIGLSSHTGIVSFEVNQQEAGSSGHQVRKDTEEGKKLIVFTLDDLCFAHGLPTPDFLKIDVDGHDYEVLKGGERLFAEKIVKSVIVERNNQEKEIIAFMLKYGYAEQQIDGKDAEINMLFEPTPSDA